MEDNTQLIRQSNVLTESRYDFDPIEKRCIYARIMREKWGVSTRNLMLTITNLMPLITKYLFCDTKILI